jgi:hypothetical protein
LQRRYTILFYSLLLTLVAAPLFAAFALTGALIELFLAANLLAAVVPVSTGKDRRVLLIIASAVWLARPLTAWFDHPALSAMTLGLWTLIGLFAASGALRFAMRAESWLMQNISMRRSAPTCSREFFSAYFTGFSTKSGQALLPPPMISPA